LLAAGEYSSQLVGPTINRVVTLIETLKVFSESTRWSFEMLNSSQQRREEENQAIHRKALEVLA
jgi:hypothetical protein